MKMVFDTNVLINGFQDDYSAPNQLLQATRDGHITAVVTPRVKKEYRLILRRLINDPDYHQQVEDFMKVAQTVTPHAVDIVIDDEDDRKFFEAAVSGQAQIIVTNDRHLLDVGELDDIQVRTPQEAWQMYQDQTDDGGGQWQQFAADLFGIGK